MLSDSASLGLALFASWLATRPATPNRSFGLQRAEILAALANGITLVAIAIFIFVEAIGRLGNPPEVLAGPMLAVAGVGLLVNVVGAFVLMHGGRESLNVAAALRHVVADLLGSVGVVVAAVIILLTGWREADALVSLAIGALVLVSSWAVLRDSVSVLLESSPRGLDARSVGRAMAASPGVVEVHDLHVWTVTSGFPALSAHVIVGDDDDCHRRRRELEELLQRDFAIEHTTLQVEHAPGEELLSIEVAGGRRPAAS